MEYNFTKKTSSFKLCKNSNFKRWMLKDLDLKWHPKKGLTEC